MILKGLSLSLSQANLNETLSRRRVCNIVLILLEFVAVVEQRAVTLAGSSSAFDTRLPGCDSHSTGDSSCVRCVRIWESALEQLRTVIGVFRQGCEERSSRSKKHNRCRQTHKEALQRKTGCRVWDMRWLCT